MVAWILGHCSKKLVTFALQQQTARTGSDEHAEASLAFDKLLVD